MIDTITFSTHTEYDFTFDEFFEIYFHNNKKKEDYAKRVWENMINYLGSSSCVFTDEVGYSDFKDVITKIKNHAEDDTYETEEETEIEEKMEKMDI